MTPEHLIEIGKTFGPVAAILLFMWMNRAPAAKEGKEDPAKQLLAKLDAMEDRIIDLQSDLRVLMDRRKP